MLQWSTVTHCVASFACIAITILHVHLTQLFLCQLSPSKPKILYCLSLDHHPKNDKQIDVADSGMILDDITVSDCFDHFGTFVKDLLGHFLSSFFTCLQQTHWIWGLTSFFSDLIHSFTLAPLVIFIRCHVNCCICSFKIFNSVLRAKTNFTALIPRRD